MCPASLRKAALAWQLVVKTKAGWAAMENAHFSLLMLPGTLVLHVPTSKARVVVQSCQYGFMSIRAPATPSKIFTLAPIAKEAVMFDYVADPSHWRVADVVFLAPGEGGNSTRGIAMTIGNKRDSLLKFASVKGFPKHTIPQLKRLYKDIGGEEALPRALTERHMLQLMLRHTLQGGFSDEKLAAALEARNTKEPELGKELINATKVFEPQLPELPEDDGDDLDYDEHDADVREQWRTLKEQAQSKTAVEASRLRAMAEVRLSSSSSSGEAGRRNGERRFVARPTIGYTGGGASLLPAPCPPVERRQAGKQMAH